MTKKIRRQFSAAQERKLQRLWPDLDRALESDRQFFARHANRSYRLRRMSRPEIETIEICNGAGSVKAPDGFTLFVAVRQIAPGLRIRGFGAIIVGPFDDFPEVICRACYEAWGGMSPKLHDFAESLASLAAQGEI